jgi:hypothetical protein
VDQLAVDDLKVTPYGQDSPLGLHCLVAERTVITSCLVILTGMDMRTTLGAM